MKSWFYPKAKIIKEIRQMSKEEFKNLFKELCSTGEIRFTFHRYNDNCTYLAIYVGNECVYEDENYISDK